MIYYINVKDAIEHFLVQDLYVFILIYIDCSKEIFTKMKGKYILKMEVNW